MDLIMNAIKSKKAFAIHLESQSKNIKPFQDERIFWRNRILYPKIYNICSPEI